MKGRRFATVVLLAALAFALRASAGVTVPVAAGGRVQLLQSTAVSARARRCLTRLREELTAGGFEVGVSEFGTGGDALWMVDPPTPRDGSLATIALIGNPDDGPAELWIVDGVSGGRAAVRRLLVPAGSSAHDDEVLAIRTLEFLRASALELARVAAAKPSPPPAPPPTAVVAAPEVSRSVARSVPLSPPPRPFSFELGMSLLESSLSLGPAYLPLARVRVERVSLLEMRLTVAGLGTRPQVTRLEESASVGQAFGLVEVRAAFRPGRAVRPAIGVGGGALLVRVEGSGKWPHEGRHGQVWSALLDVGVGLTVALGWRLAIAAEAHGQLTAPYPTVQFSGQEVARLGRPALLTSLTVVTPL